jgi:hypothetical protein
VPLITRHVLHVITAYINMALAICKLGNLAGEQVAACLADPLQLLARHGAY